MPWWGWTLAGVSIFAGAYACWVMRSAGDDAELFEDTGAYTIGDGHRDARRIFPEL
jgi:hypothetical protein